MVQCIITRSFNFDFNYTLSARGKAVNGFNSICGRKGVIINMRLDKYLKVSRLIKRRTVANEACDAGKISVNGKIARASYDVKTGDILAYTGSISSAMYFPDQVELDNDSHAIDYMVMAAPVFQGGKNYAVQQGAGMVVSKSDEKHEYAAVEFLKWFTQAENNLRFGCVSGYLPVQKEANSSEKLDQVIADQKLSVASKTYDCLTTIFDEMGDMTLYTNKSFKNGSAARKILEYHLADKAAKDRTAVKALLEQGKSLEEAAEPYVTKAAFEAWYDSFCDALQTAIDG